MLNRILSSFLYAPLPDVSSRLYVQGRGATNLYINHDMWISLNSSYYFALVQIAYVSMQTYLMLGVLLKLLFHHDLILHWRSLPSASIMVSHSAFVLYVWFSFLLCSGFTLYNFILASYLPHRSHSLDLVFVPSLCKFQCHNANNTSIKNKPLLEKSEFKYTQINRETMGIAGMRL